VIRPAALTLLRRWREVIGSAIFGALGLWMASRGGYVFLPLGMATAIAALGYGLPAYRRVRFAQDTAAAGFVEVTEGQIAYFADDAGGFVSLPELVELRLITLSYRRFWRLKQRDGQALLIPVDAAQNAALFDAFAALPHMNSAALVAALTSPPQAESGTQTLWRRDGP
jgi:hypothetical protein